jgi:hypothetical protein
MKTILAVLLAAAAGGAVGSVITLACARESVVDMADIPPPVVLVVPVPSRPPAPPVRPTRRRARVKRVKAPSGWWVGMVNPY